MVGDRDETGDTAPPSELKLLRESTACYLAIVKESMVGLADFSPAGDLVADLAAATGDGPGTPASIGRRVAVLLGLATPASPEPGADFPASAFQAAW